MTAIIGVDGDRGPCRPDASERTLGSHAHQEDRAVDFTLWVVLAERATLDQGTYEGESSDGV
jgi:hypothetical protein